MKFWARNDKYNWICNYSANKGGKGLNNTGKGATVLLIYLLTFGVNTNACKTRRPVSITPMETFDTGRW